VIFFSKPKKHWKTGKFPKSVYLLHTYMDKQTPWTKAEIETLRRLSKKGALRPEIEKEMKTRTWNSILNKASRIKCSIPRPQDSPKAKVAPLPTVKGEMEKAKQDLDIEHRRRLEKVNKKLAKQRALEDRLVDAFSNALATGPITLVPPTIRPTPIHTGKHTPEVAVLVLSDLHVGKQVFKDQTNGYGDYNMLETLRKGAYLRDKPILLNKEGFIRVRELHVFLLGDIIDGQLDHAEEIPGHELLVDQIYLATLLLYQMLATYCRHFDKVTVSCLGGNHARYPNQKKPPTQGRRSNYDTVVFQNLEAMFDVANGNGLLSLPSGSGVAPKPYPITFNIARAADLLVDVNGHRFCLSHGDELKGGDKALGVPSHSIGRKISAWSQRLAANNEAPVDYFVVGDKHRQMALPTAGGQFMINGAWPGVDPYSLEGSFSPNRPIQLFFGVHKKYGKTWDYSLYLDPRLVGRKPLNQLGFTLPKPLAETVLTHSML
jgi:hypothetical protein